MNANKSLFVSAALVASAVVCGGALSACQKVDAVGPTVATAASTPIAAATSASAASMPPIRFFGDDFPEAYQNLEKKPAEPAPATF